MNRPEALLIAVLALSMAGCVVGAKTQPAAATPAPPQPEPPPAAPAPPAQPLSIPQTQVELPQPQPISEEALRTTEAPQEQTAGTIPPATVVRPPRTKSAPVPPQRTETPQPTPPAAPATAPAALPEARGAITEELDPAEKNRLREAAQSHKREIRQWLTAARAKRLNKDTVSRIQGFLKGSDDAERRGDMRQASALADRALILLRELQGGQ